MARRSSLKIFRSPTSVAALVVLALLTLMAIFGERLFGTAATVPNVDIAELGPSWAHPFGTDKLGRDVFARCMASTRSTLGRAITSGLAAAAVGAMLGIGISLMRSTPRLKALALRAVEVGLAFPALLVAIFVTAILGASGTAATIGVGIALIPGITRLGQSISASVVERDYVRAAEQLGLGRFTILRRHILPNVAEPMVTAAASATAVSLIAISSLSFLQLGVQPPAFDWGTVLADGLKRIYSDPWSALGPAMLITVTGASIAYLADAVGRHASRREVHAAQGPTAQAHAGTTDDVVLSVSRLSVTFATATGEITPVRDVSIEVRRGEIVGIVGESGSGKSATSMAISELLPPNARVDADRWEMIGAAEPITSVAGRRKWLATRIGVVFQDSMTSLNPAIRIGRQVSEANRIHRGISQKAADDLAVERLRDVQIAAPEMRARQFPHEFSGGMRQRAVIAMGMVNHPALLIADEPTTALDVTIQDQVLRLLKRLNEEEGSAILFISHDLAVVSELCARVLVMYGGTVVEEIEANRLAEAQHPYTKALLAASPSLDDVVRPEAIPGTPPDPRAFPPGCPFAPRCADAMDRCHGERPELVAVPTPVEISAASAHRSACFLVEAPVPTEVSV